MSVWNEMLSYIRKRSQVSRGIFSTCGSSASSSSFFMRYDDEYIFFVSFKYSFHKETRLYVGGSVRKIKRHFPTVVSYLSLRRRHSQEKSLKYKCTIKQIFFFCKLLTKKMVSHRLCLDSCFVVHRKIPFCFSVSINLNRTHLSLCHFYFPIFA